jgi:NhaP-type Na+/H+ or K+/H+ antiporter
MISTISTFGLAYLIFYVADIELGVSAVLALVVMGLFMAKHIYCISSHVQLCILHFMSDVYYPFLFSIHLYVGVVCIYLGKSTSFSFGVV